METEGHVVVLSGPGPIRLPNGVTVAGAEEVLPTPGDRCVIGEGTLEYSLSDDAVWLSVNPSGGTSTGEADTITINYTTEYLPIGGPYDAAITITDPNASNSPQTVTVQLTVSPSPYAPADFDLCDVLYVTGHAVRSAGT